MRDYTLRSARFLAAEALRRFLLPGDIAIDATMGNGHDTQLLCELVGDSGHVFAFDIQSEAITNTKVRLENAGLIHRASLYCIGHEHMSEFVQSPVQAVVFNLGWLPGGNKQITTRWETTRSAILQALSLLVQEGLCVICVYPGHAEGDHERSELFSMLKGLKPQDFNVLHHRFINAGPGAPECFILQKQPGSNFDLSRKNT